MVPRRPLPGLTTRRMPWSHSAARSRRAVRSGIPASAAKLLLLKIWCSKIQSRVWMAYRERVTSATRPFMVS